jgi:hypothetical protein
MSTSALTALPTDVLGSSILAVLNDYVGGSAWTAVPAKGDIDFRHTHVLMQGPTTETISVSVPAAHLLPLASRILGDSPVDLRDMLFEVANTVAGNLKPLIGPHYATGIPAAGLPTGICVRRLGFTSDDLYLEVGTYE